jgi:hypothetical protein
MGLRRAAITGYSEVAVAPHRSLAPVRQTTFFISEREEGKGWDRR